MDKYGKNLKDIYGEEVLNSNTVDGFMYGVPNQIERGSIPAVFMRKDLVEKYNIDTSAIKEPKDMESVFETVKAGETDMTMLFSINEGDTPATRLFGGDPCQMPTTLACSWIRKMIPPSPTSLPATGIKRLLPCSMTGIKRDISARTRELTQKTGVQSARQAICSPCFLPIIREHL